MKPTKEMPTEFGKFRKNLYLCFRRNRNPKGGCLSLLTTNNMQTIEQYIALAQKAVDTIACPTGRQPEGLYEPIVYGLEQGGKRLRPLILLAACDAVGGDCTKALPQAAAIEEFHNFTLLHDDVMDRADLRRGKPTVCNKWDDNTAILSGDTMLTLATQMVVDGVEPAKAIELLKVFNATAIGVYEGQQYDMEFESRNDVTIEEYLEMIRLKTSVLLAGAARLGAIMGNAAQHQADGLHDFAVNLGIAFQLQDDWLDVYGDPEVFGKAIGGDIMNNKKTYLLINAQNKATGADKEELDYWLGNKAAYPGEKIAGVTSIYDRLAIGDLCREAVDAYSKKALEALHGAGLSAEATEFFEAFDKMVMGRKK